MLHNAGTGFECRDAQGLHKSGFVGVEGKRCRGHALCLPLARPLTQPLGFDPVPIIRPLKSGNGLRIDPIAAPPNRLDQGGILRFTTDFLAQFADENVDNLHFRLVNAAIEMVEKSFLADNPTAAQAQKFQHLIFLIGQIERAAMNAGLTRVQIQREFAKFQHIFAVTIGPAHQRLKRATSSLE